AYGWILCEGHGSKRHRIGVPADLVIPAGKRECSKAFAASRRHSAELPPDGSGCIGIRHVQREAGPLREALAQLLEVSHAMEPKDAANRPGLEPGRSERERMNAIWVAREKACAAGGRQHLIVRRRGVQSKRADDRTARGQQDAFLVRFAIFHGDGFNPAFARNKCTSLADALAIRPYFLQKKYGIVHEADRQAPGTR